LAEAFHLLGPMGKTALIDLLRRESLGVTFDFHRQRSEVLDLMKRYASVPMSFSDACLVRMTEMLPNPIVLTTDSDFRIYRRFRRQTVPCAIPARARPD